MNKTLLVFQREYLTRVKKKSFVLTTILVPVVIAAFYAAIIGIAMIDNGDESNKIAVIDNASLFNGKITVDSTRSGPSYSLITGETETSFEKKYKEQGYDYLLVIPQTDLNKEVKGIKLIGQLQVSGSLQNKIERTLDKAIEAKRLQSANIAPEQYASIKSDVDIENILKEKDREKKGATDIAKGVAYVCGILIYIILMIYGTMVMRGVMEEKMNRIAEVIVSSVKPFQLMLGKILGIGAVGLTQFAIWIVLITILQLFVPMLMPSSASSEIVQGATNAAATGGGFMQNISAGLSALPIGLILFCFIFYFIGGYLLYASLFAAIGSVVSEDQQEAQQLVFPVMMPIILAFVIMTKAITAPNSALAIFGSLFPLTSPVVMMGRIVVGVPFSQLITSMILLVLGFIFFTWLTAKIYRTGILLYGKKVTWKEMMKWAFRKA
jgi:ABC-2 type transport system permease protein